jgi:Protein of unknown function (DUF3172)
MLLLLLPWGSSFGKQVLAVGTSPCRCTCSGVDSTLHEIACIGSTVQQPSVCLKFCRTKACVMTNSASASVACLCWCMLASSCLAFFAVAPAAPQLQRAAHLQQQQQRSVAVWQQRSSSRKARVAARFARRADDDDEDDFDDYAEEEFNLPRRRRQREQRRFDAERYESDYDDLQPPPPKKVWGLTRKKGGFLDSIPKALLAGIFVLGIGTGVTVDSAINTNPKDLASRDAIDRNAPNPGICQTYGSSAMVVDQRVFVTFNPFSIYVSQADVKPGCVLRQSNFVQVSFAAAKATVYALSDQAMNR